MQNPQNAANTNVDKPKPTSWEDCISFTQNNTLSEQGIARLQRLAHLTAAYKKQMEQKKKLYVTYADFIKHEILQFDVKQVRFEDNSYKLEVIAKDDQYNYCCLRANEFPYHLEAPIEHLVLFATHPMSKEEIQSKMKCTYPSVQYVWWENPIQKRSIPDVWHAHILIK